MARATSWLSIDLSTKGRRIKGKHDWPRIRMAPLGAAHSRARYGDEQSVQGAHSVGGLSIGARSGDTPHRGNRGYRLLRYRVTDYYVTELPTITLQSYRLLRYRVTDYYVTETYERVLDYKRAGRLPSARLIFPNVEVRLDVATAKGGFVNLHLFVSPEDPDHVAELQRLFEVASPIRTGWRLS